MRTAIALYFASIPLFGQVAEPVLTKTAIPFEPGAGIVKADVISGIAGTRSAQVIPEATLEVGVLPGWEVLVRFPLLRTQTPVARVGGGQLAVGARRLVLGSAEGPLAVSLQGVFEAATGNSHLVGSATQVMPSIYAQWRPWQKVTAYSNLTYDRSIGGSPKATFFEFSHAVEWNTTARFAPVFEFVGSTNEITGKTQLVAQPEAILLCTRHLDLKAGMQFGLNRNTPTHVVRLQAAWHWGLIH